MYKYGYSTVEFEWDEVKDLVNQKKHGVTFLEATECFFDPSAIVLADAKHSYIEKRYYWIGRSSQNRVLTIWYTKRGNIVRIIGAAEWRKMRKVYETTKL